VTFALRPTRRTGGALLAFGAVGLGLMIATGALVLGSLSAVDDAVTGFDRQRTEIVALLEPAATALANAADSVERAGASLTQASDAAERAAALTTSLADSFEGLAALGTFEIFGARPFAALSERFLSVGANARSLTTSLQATAASLHTNSSDSAAVALNLRTLAGQLQHLAASLGAPQGGGTTAQAAAAQSATTAIGVARLLLLGILAWLAVPAVATAWIGWRLLRSATV
jgi:hypothetical protein